MKDKIIEFILACEDYPETEELVDEFCQLMFPKRAIQLMKELLELIDEGRIFYDSEDETWAVLPKVITE